MVDLGIDVVELLPEGCLLDRDEPASVAMPDAGVRWFPRTPGLHVQTIPAAGRRGEHGGVVVGHRSSARAFWAGEPIHVPTIEAAPVMAPPRRVPDPWLRAPERLIEREAYLRRLRRPRPVRKNGWVVAALVAVLAGLAAALRT